MRRSFGPLRRLLIALVMALGLVLGTAGVASADKLCFRVWVGEVVVEECVPLV